jgi:CRISPR system Cascade subunit CasE
LLVANPVKTISDERGRRNTKGDIKKCRVPLICEEEQRAWLERKLNDRAQIETVIIDPKLSLNFRKGKGHTAGKIQPLRFQVILTINQASAFEELVVAGIGPAKAFGCGLISIANAS